MTYNIGLMPSFNVNKPDSSSKAAFFSSNITKKSCSFRDVLSNTVRCRDQNEMKADEVTDTEKELVRKSEAKLKPNSSDNVEPLEQAEEKQKGKNDDIIEELLMKLDELANMNDSEDITGNKQTQLLEDIKKILTELEEIQTGSIGQEAPGLQKKLAELTAVIEDVQKESEANGSISDMETVTDLSKKLKEMVSEVQHELRSSLQKPSGSNAAEQLLVEKDSSNREPAKSEIASEENSDKDSPVIKLSEKDYPTEKSSVPRTTEGNQKPVANTADPAPKDPTAKEAKSEAIVQEDSEKAAIDSKVEKITVEVKPDKGEETDNTEHKEAAKEAYRAINTAQDKPDIEAAVRQEQSIIYNKAEAVQNQAAAPKAQTLDRVQIISQIVKKAEVILTDAHSEMRMQLEPENLGRLTLKIAVERGLITAKFTAESYEVKQAIESNFNELKDMLQDKGLEIQNLSVSVGHDSKEFDYSKNSELWSDRLKAGGKNIRTAISSSYLEGVGTAARVNPYSVHDGEFDQRA